MQYFTALFSPFTVKKVEYRSNWSEWSTCVNFAMESSSKKWTIIKKDLENLLSFLNFSLSF